MVAALIQQPKVTVINQPHINHFALLSPVKLFKPALRLIAAIVKVFTCRFFFL